MAIRITDRDVALLWALAEHRMLTVEQLAHLRDRNIPALRRRLGRLVEEELVAQLPVSPTVGKRGRPEKVFGVDSKAITLLVDRGLLPKSIKPSQVTGESLLPQAGHQLLLNWFRIHLVAMSRCLSELEVLSVAHNSPRGDQDNYAMAVPKDTGLSGRGSSDSLVPDLAFCVREQESGRALLFFLEVDMDTEPHSSRSRGNSHIVGKIERYQSCFRSRTYRQFGRLWNHDFHGFRLLFLCHRAECLPALCRVVTSHPPSDFIWLATQPRLFEQGASGNIWARGGRPELGLQSIVGRFAAPAPLPSRS
jgi:Replication-relaxation